MIINIRGTGGSGKSTIVRSVMSRYAHIEPEYQAGRRQPIGYLCSRPERPLFVVGHYNSPCGGGDTMKTPGEVYALAFRELALGHDVIFEGIISQDDVTRTVALSKAAALQGGGLLVIALDVPIEDCLAGIQTRRDAREDARPLNPKNTVERAKRLAGIMRRLYLNGVQTQWAGRGKALDLTYEALGIDWAGPVYQSSVNRTLSLLEGA